METMEAGTTWAQLGLEELYGQVAVNTTDPVRSNSGNMFAGLLANVLCGGVADEDSVEAVLPRLRDLFEKLGYMESSPPTCSTSSSRPAWGAKPMMAGYENQLLEFAVENPEDWAQLKDDIVLLSTPTPTVLVLPHLHRPGRRGAGGASTPCWTRRSSAWPGKITASAPRYPARTPTKTTSASPTWPARSPRWPPCPVRRHGEDHRRTVVKAARATPPGREQIKTPHPVHSEDI